MHHRLLNPARNCLFKLLAVAAPVLLTAFVWATCGAATSQAQGTRVVVVDVARIFREHPRLAQHREEFRRESEAAEAKIQQEQNNLKKLAEQLKQYKPGTDAYRELERKIANDAADLEIQMRLKAKEMREREAKIQYQTYVEIVNLVARFCERNGVSMVLSYSSKPVDDSDPRAIQAALNRSIIYQKNLDITDHILAELKRGIPPTPVSSGRPLIPQRR